MSKVGHGMKNKEKNNRNRTNRMQFICKPAYPICKMKKLASSRLQILK